MEPFAFGTYIGMSTSAMRQLTEHGACDYSAFIIVFQGIQHATSAALLPVSAPPASARTGAGGAG
jgi:hypothetical protein